ncbi:MAG: CHAT domain-containing protein [Anaerolineae bacterium]|nr:CHAT domain-containing protein [Candidatus Roseilinea sp.]MDW8449640.1 CHAT domain-containing protein [Anaerolineae bacterium]
MTRRRAEVDARLDALEAGDPAFAAQPPGYADMAVLARRHGFTIVFLVPTDEAELGTLAFLVGPDERGAPEVLRLAGLTRGRLRDLLFALPEGMTFSEAPNALGARWALDDGRAPENVGWLAAYWLTHLARARDRALARPNDWEPRARRLWHATMQRVLKTLGDALMGPLAERLAALGARRVVLIPGDRLGLLPLHAAPSSPPAPFPGGEGPGVRAFLDAFEVSYAPSAAALAAALARAGGERSAPALVAIANPDGSLAFADDEVAAIAAGFDGRAQVAYGPAATRAWLLARAGQADYLELSTHGSFAPGEPEQSGLLLAHPAGHTWPLWRADISPERQELEALQAGCERLTLDDIWAGRLPLKPGCVVSLDACETAQTESGEEADESLGFPAALLSAGAATVIASLWAVDDFSTSLLMTEAYRRMLAGERPSLALQQAGQWLRRLSKAEVLARLDAAIAAMEAEERAGEWERLPLAEYAQRRYRLAALANRRASLNDAPEDPPFAHPVWWAAFAAYGA